MVSRPPSAMRLSKTRVPNSPVSPGSPTFTIRACRICWKAWLISKSCCFGDARIAWSRARSWRPTINALAGSKLVVFENCGHRPEIEKTEQFVNEVKHFLAA